MVTHSASAVPGVDECLALMEEHGMLANIREHSLVVAGLAEGLRQRLARVGVTLSRGLVCAGALLHDIAKSQCLEERCNHARIGADICLDLGFVEVAGIVAEHVFLSAVPDFPTAAVLVYYADKRVNHDRVVSLDERRDYIISRYGNGDPGRISAIRANIKIWRRVEELIFAGLDLVPADLDQGFVVDVAGSATKPFCHARIVATGGGR